MASSFPISHNYIHQYNYHRYQIYKQLTTIPTMQKQNNNWYSQYDSHSLPILKDPNYFQQIYNVASTFRDFQGPITNQDQKLKQSEKWVTDIADTFIKITTLFDNFFRAQFTYSKDKNTKNVFGMICLISKVESEYGRYFFTSSSEFRIRRMLASGLRLNKYLIYMLPCLDDLKKDMDQKLKENVALIQKFMLQRILQTLQQTKSQGNNILNIIIMNMLLVLQRNAGDSTIKDILDATKEEQLIQDILKFNQIQDQFMKNKLLAQAKFQGKTIVVQGMVEEDTSVKKVEVMDREWE